MLRLHFLLLLLLSLCNFNVFAQDFQSDGLLYTVLSIEDKTVEVSGYTNEITGNFSIPSSVSNEGSQFTVVSIGDYALNSCTELSYIKIPNSVTTIGDHAFGGCTGLMAVDIPNSVLYIENGAFGGCTSITSINIPNSVLSIGVGAFYGCTGLTSIDIPDSLTFIAGDAFIGCESLTNFSGKFASDDHRCLIMEGCLVGFAPCGLTSYSVPNSVTSIASNTFLGCDKLNYIEIPNSVNNIGSSVFQDCTGLTSIEIPNSVTTISSCTFEGCSSLTSIKIPNSVTYIAWGAFGFCTSLKTIDLPNSITFIENFAFNQCTSLSSVHLPNSITFIGECMFKNCFSLTSIDIPNTVTWIGESAFNGCVGLKSVRIPNSVNKIRGKAFKGCTGLLEIWVQWENPAEVYVMSDEFTTFNNTTLYVPLGTIEKYKQTYPWNKFKEIKEYVSWDNEETNKCDIPTINIENNNLVFKSSTPNVKFNYTIICDDNHASTDSDNGIVELNGTYQISVYAYTEGLDNSDAVTATLVWVNPQIEDTDILKITTKKAVLIKSVGNNIQISGTEKGESIQLYSTNGILLDIVKAEDDETFIPYNLQRGETYIIKYGNKSIKYRF